MSIADVRSVVASEVATQLAEKLTPVTAALAAIQTDQQAMVDSMKKRNTDDDKLLKQRRAKLKD